MKQHALKTPCPVSKKFYTYVSGRVRESLMSIGQEEAVAETMACIDRYMAAGSLPAVDSCPAVLLIFSILRPEIDKAILRSSRARRRSVQKSSTSADNHNRMESADAMKTVVASAEDNLTAVGLSAESDGAGKEDGSPERFIPRNRRERRLYEQEVRRATRRLIRRLSKA